MHCDPEAAIVLYIDAALVDGESVSDGVQYGFDFEFACGFVQTVADSPSTREAKLCDAVSICLSDNTVATIMASRGDTHAEAICINANVHKELDYIVQLHKAYGAPRPVATVQELVDYILSSFADGSRRPGSWERQMLESMGIVADSPAHQIYRSPPWLGETGAASAPFRWSL
jgi:hypothetical protein